MPTANSAIWWKWTLRASIAGFVILSVSLRFAAPTRTEANSDPVLGIESVLGSRLSGPLSNNGWGSPENPTRIVSARVVGCVDPLLIIPIESRFTNADALLTFQKPGDRHYFAYLNWISREPDRWRLFRMRIWQRVRETLYESNSLRSDVMLYINESGDCHVVETIDWRKYWQAA
jgi:hypothetical protein